MARQNRKSCIPSCTNLLTKMIMRTVPADFEGIGEGTWNFPPDFDTKDCVYHLIRCEDNGEVIFDWSDAVGWNVVRNQRGRFW